MDTRKNIQDLSSNDLVAFLFDLFHRTTIHHALWFAELMHQYGREKAYEMLDIVYKQSYDIQMKRISKILGADTSNGYPQPLLDLPREKQMELMEGLSVNWLANDGVWFQQVEKTRGMTEAKRCNDSCWANFSPFEASAIKRLLKLPENPGLEGLKQALFFRLYAFINKQSIGEETEKSFVFYMNDCRVQSARKRKGMDDYPCKSGGTIEYSSFAETIDARIKTECICCPPDAHPDTHYCAWKFSIE
jgi:hypothetical protein